MSRYIVTKPDSQRRRNDRRPDSSQDKGVAVYVLDGDKWKAGKCMYQRRAGGNGIGLSDWGDGMYTLTGIDRHIVALCLPHKSRPRYIRRICEGGVCVREEMR